MDNKLIGVDGGAAGLTGAHSEKGLATLAAMGTTPADWGLAEIIWKDELRTVPTKVACPECHRTGQARYLKATGKLAVRPENIYSVEANAWYEANTNGRERCHKCPAKRNHWGGQYGTGEITAMVERVVPVGYIQWAAGTIFDSRFNDHRDCFTACQLCSKTIKYSNVMPVTGRGADGRIHGMFVGSDCARKFFGIKNFKKDQTLDLKGVA